MGALRAAAGSPSLTPGCRKPGGGTKSAEETLLGAPARRQSMQQTIRVLRITLPIVFIGFIILIAVSWKRNQGGRKEPKANEPVVGSRTQLGEKPQLESKGFEDTQTIAGRIAAHIVAKRL